MSDNSEKKPVMKVAALHAAMAICAIQHERGMPLTVEELAGLIERQWRAMRGQFINECADNWRAPAFEHQGLAALRLALEKTLDEEFPG